MPSQLIHLDVCAGALEAMEARRPGAGRGSGAPDGQLLLGAIAPDAWHLAGLRREQTHFWSPRHDTSGLVRLARAHPRLAHPRSLPGPQRAFLAGYFCHLVTDEQWTFTVYRPYFGRRSLYRAAPPGPRLQQALQQDLEQGVRDRRPHDLAAWLAALALADPAAGAAVPFVAPAAVGRWRDLQLAASRLPTAEAAFGYVLEQTQPPAPRAADAAPPPPAEWPELVTQVRAHVPAVALADFRLRAGAACAAVLAAWWPYNARP